MKIHLEFLDNGTILVRARAEGDDETVGDFSQDVGPGEMLFLGDGIQYETLKANGPGEMTI